MTGDGRAGGFEEQEALRDHDGTVLHARVRVGPGLVMIGPGMDEYGTRPVGDPAWATSRIHVVVEDLDAHHERSVVEGATIVSEPTDQFGGLRIYVASDCGGQQWIFAQPSDAEPEGALVS